MRTFVSIDTESGIIHRYSENARPTHEAGLTHDPDDGDATRHVIEGFRANPHPAFQLVPRGLRTYEDALLDQRLKRAIAAEKQILLGPPSHRDEA